MSIQQISDMLTKLLDTASYLKAKIKRDQLEIALNQATNDDNWQASTTVLHEISSSAYNQEKWKKIRDFLWDKLENTKNWRKILKALNIIQFLIKNGPGFAVNELKYHKNFFGTLTTYQEYDNGTDRGASIRERAKAILGLLQNDELLQDERLRAKQIREKMSHFSGSASWNSEEGQKESISTNKYQSFNNSTFQKVQQRSESPTYYNYGSGNYGDREQDTKFNHDYFQNINRFKNQEKPKSNPQVQQNRDSTKKIQMVVKNQSPKKNNFDSLSKKLVKIPSKNLEGVVKPDLSYKKQQPDLIDVEAYFVQTKYNLHENQQKTTTSLPQKSVESKSPQKQEQGPTNKQADLLNQFQGLSFLGSSTSQQKESQSSASPQNKIVQDNPNVSAPLTGLSHPPPANNGPIINYSLTYNQIGPIQPTYNNPYGLGSNYSPYGYNTNPYQQMQNSNPYAGMSNPQYNHYPAPQCTPAYSNPYQNSLSGASINMKADLMQQKKVKSETSNPKINEQKLTDLSDLVLEIGKQPKSKQTQKSKGVNNNLKIDPWAW